MLMNVKRTDAVEKSLSRLFAGISGVLVTIALAVSVAPQAHARNAETVSRAVSYADLDLSVDHDVRRLEHRIRLTARKLCTPDGVAEIQRLKEGRRCSNAAASDALRQMNGRVR
jgi:UrcA family protein